MVRDDGNSCVWIGARAAVVEPGVVDAGPGDRVAGPRSGIRLDHDGPVRDLVPARIGRGARSGLGPVGVDAVSVQAIERVGGRMTVADCRRRRRRCTTSGVTCVEPVVVGRVARAVVVDLARRRRSPPRGRSWTRRRCPMGIAGEIAADLLLEAAVAHEQRHALGVLVAAARRVDAGAVQVDALDGHRVRRARVQRHHLVLGHRLPLGAERVDVGGVECRWSRNSRGRSRWSRW